MFAERLVKRAKRIPFRVRTYLEDGYFEVGSYNGTPPWEDITVWLQRYDDQHDRLTARERDFVNQMAERVLWHEPSERQARWLLEIFRRLGGRIR